MAFLFPREGEVVQGASVRGSIGVAFTGATRIRGSIDVAFVCYPYVIILTYVW